MKEKEKTFWELIISKAYGRTFRARVPGGWLVRDGYKARDRCLNLNMLFVPDPDHAWEL